MVSYVVTKLGLIASLINTGRKKQMINMSCKYKGEKFFNN